ncbi:uncharacterized protein [Triticum aestivum]|uniref:uncharacterized protein isoform X2 n=1 Tax=Triticum aestivum TaxID=4565 RepID=UPI001D00EDAC|nr:uncharacterized protein LOC123141159 isoform X2 [Triticum aestivum]
MRQPWRRRRNQCTLPPSAGCSAASMETPDPRRSSSPPVSPAACSTSCCAMGAIQIEHGHERRRAPLPARLLCRRRLAHRRPAEWSTSGAVIPAVTCASLRRRSAAHFRLCRASAGHVAQMENNYPPGYPLYKDLTNTTTEGNGAPHLQQKKATGQVWYAQMSDEKKAEFLQKHRLARQEKKVAALESVGTDQVAHAPASSSRSVQCTHPSDKTYRRINACVTTTP